MKRILLALIVVACGTTVSAQSTVKSNTSKSNTMKAADSKDSKEDAQISKALLQDEDLQDKVFKSLDENKTTNAALASIYKQTEGDKVNMMKQILRDKKLSTIAIQYVKDNPEMMEKVMKMVKN